MEWYSTAPIWGTNSQTRVSSHVSGAVAAPGAEPSSDTNLLPDNVSDNVAIADILQ